MRTVVLWEKETASIKKRKMNESEEKRNDISVGVSIESEADK